MEQGYEGACSVGVLGWLSHFGGLKSELLYVCLWGVIWLCCLLYCCLYLLYDLLLCMLFDFELFEGG